MADDESTVVPNVEMREALERLGLTQRGLARAMRRLGDNRPEDNIEHAINRAISGRRPYSGEMRALLGLMTRHSRSDLTNLARGQDSGAGTPQPADTACKSTSSPS